MRRWRSLLELSPACGQAALESLPVYALTLIIPALAPRAGSIALPMLAGLPIACALLASSSVHWPLRFVFQRALLLIAGVLLLFMWMHQVLAPTASWQPRSWLVAVTEPWRVGLSIGGGWVFWAWVSGSYLTYRGLLIGVQSDSELSRWFGVGAITWVLLFAFLARAGLRDSQLPSETLHALAVSYFVFGLALTAFDRRRRVFAREGLRAPVSLAFLVALGLPIACVTCVAVLAVDGLRGVRRVGAVGWHALQEIGRWLWQALALGGQGLQLLLHWLGRFGPSGVHGEPARAPHARASDLPAQWGFKHPPAVQVAFDALPVILIAAALIALVLLGAAMFRRATTERRRELLEESDSVFSRELLQHQLRALLGALRTRLRRRPDGLRGWLSQPPSAASAAAPISDMRAAYRSLLLWAAAHGQTRAFATTPDEFAVQLGRSHPSLRREITSLTRYYVTARYGNAPTSDPDLAHARRLLQALAEWPSVKPAERS